MRAWLVSVGLSVATIVATLLGLEVGVRLWAGVPVLTTNNFVGIELDQIHKPGNPGVNYDPILGWVHKPNVEAKTWTTGAYGVRMSSPKITPVKEGGILVVGDSFAVGSGVDDKDTWPAALERILGTQVINAAVGGYGFDQVVIRAEQLIPVLKPRMVLLQGRIDYGVSVAQMSSVAGAPKSYYTVSEGKLSIHDSPVPRVISSASNLGLVRSVLGHLYLAHFVMQRLDAMQWWIGSALPTKFETTQDDALNVSCLLMKRLTSLGKKSGLPVMLVSQYAGVDSLTKELPWQKEHDRFIDCAATSGIGVIDTLPALRAAYLSGGLDHYKSFFQMSGDGSLYGHMSAAGNEFVAEQIAKALKNNAIAASE